VFSFTVQRTEKRSEGYKLTKHEKYQEKVERTFLTFSKHSIASEALSFLTNRNQITRKHRKDIESTD
jgi:hypothetical protein